MANEFRIRFTDDYAERLIYLFYLIKTHDLLEGKAEPETKREVEELADWFGYAYDRYKAKKEVDEKWMT